MQIGRCPELPILLNMITGTEQNFNILNITIIEMQNHTELLNYIAAKIGAKSYLEIGTNNCRNFNAIQVAHKVGVDPDLNSPCSIHKTSDEFFKDNAEKFDLIFIDGLHHSEQVKKDFDNSFNFLSEAGVIVIHDCNPSEEKHTHIPRITKIWNGDVYRFVSTCLNGYGGINFFTIDFDHGCCVVRKRVGREANGMDFRLNFLAIGWQYFNENRGRLLNLVSVEQGIKFIDFWT
jgi:hypothetical protein